MAPSRGPFACHATAYGIISRARRPEAGPFGAFLASENSALAPATCEPNPGVTPR
jgi:hypothetical protein